MTIKSHTNRITIFALLVLPLLLGPIISDAQRMRHGGGGGRPARGGGAPMRSATTRNNPRTINGGSQRAPNRGGNKVNVDKSRRNVNVNIDNSKHVNVNRNTVVRSNRVYARPPYRYGGMRFYAFRPYFYHPFRPFYWGPIWHPWGFFIATLATTAIIISIENQHYHYDQGVYYVQSGSGYTVVEAPVGATIKVLPEGAETVKSETTNNYYYGGTYYDKVPEGFKVVPPTAGTVVEHLPEGAKEVKVGDQTFVKYGEVYYQPIQQDGKNMYEVVDVKEGEDDK